jgi:hypothetical protein
VLKFQLKLVTRYYRIPTFYKILKIISGRQEAEASYFFEAGGDRVMVFIVNMESPDMIPSIAEPLFQGFGAKVEFHPVMVFDDLKKAVQNLSKL